MKFVYQTEDSVRALFASVFSILDIVAYRELEDDDSLYVLAAV